jgi:D-threo-aldose 1-dehydrogenase
MTTEGKQDFPTLVQRYYRAHGATRQAIGMGCATIGWQADTEKLRQFQRTLDFAFENSIRYFDTSAQYGGSEFRLGEFLRRVPREEVFVATKSPISSALSPSETALFLRQAIQNSLERLSVSHIDLFQVHDVSSLDTVFAPGGGLESLQAAQAEGLIGYIGLGVRSHDLLEQAAFSGAFDTILTYMDYTPINTSAADLIRKAAERGVGVVNGSPLSFGLLTGTDPRLRPLQDSNHEYLLANATGFYDLCQANQWSVVGAAMQFPLRNPGISLTLTGPGSPEELAATLAAIDTQLPEEAWAVIAQEMGLPHP